MKEGEKKQRKVTKTASFRSHPSINGNFQLGYFKKLLSVVEIFRCKLPERSKAEFLSLGEVRVLEILWLSLGKLRAKTTKELAILMKNDVSQTRATWG